MFQCTTLNTSFLIKENNQGYPPSIRINYAGLSDTYITKKHIIYTVTHYVIKYYITNSCDHLMTPGVKFSYQIYHLLSYIVII